MTRKDKTEFNGIESEIYEKVVGIRNTDWFPQNASLSLGIDNTGEDARESSLEKFEPYIQEYIDYLGVLTKKVSKTKNRKG